MQDQLTLQVDRPGGHAQGPVREWTGRDAVALRKALRMTEARFARAVDVAPRTVANWHAKPETVPRNAAQDMLDVLHSGASAVVVERFERFAGQWPALGQPAPAETGARPVPTAGGTLCGPPPAAPDAAPAAIPAHARLLGGLAGARGRRAVNGSGGQVIRLGTHPRYAADFKPLACGLVASARTALGLTLGEFAALLESALGWAVMPEAAGRWETESVPPGDVVLFCQAFLAGAHGGGPAAPDTRGRDELTVRRAARRQR